MSMPSMHGEDAVNSRQRKPFDVIVLDIEMPVMDGITAARSIRKLGGAPGTRRSWRFRPSWPIPMQSASWRDTFDIALPKPANRNELHAAVKVGARPYSTGHCGSSGWQPRPVMLHGHVTGHPASRGFPPNVWAESGSDRLPGHRTTCVGHVSRIGAAGERSRYACIVYAQKLARRLAARSPRRGLRAGCAAIVESGRSKTRDSQAGCQAGHAAATTIARSGGRTVQAAGIGGLPWLRAGKLASSASACAGIRRVPG